MSAVVHLLLGALVLVAPPDVELANARRVEASIAAGDLAKASKMLRGGEFSEPVEATLQGRLALAEARSAAAERHFRSAMKLVPDHAPLRLLTAHALLQQGKFKPIAKLLDHPDLPPTDLGVALVLAAAEDGAGDHAAAYKTLRRAAKKNPDEPLLRRELVMLCARHGRLETAREWAASLTPAQLGRDVALAVMQGIRGQRGSERLGRWLAAAFANDADVQGQLGFILSAAGEPRPAALAFARAGLGFESAEHHRVARDYRAALRANARVADPERRGQQRFDILFESGALARAVAVGEALSDAHGLAPRRQYNLAYAHYALQQYADATTWVRPLLSTGEADRARALLRAMGR